MGMSGAVRVMSWAKVSNPRAGRRSFTLVEILVVVAIIGVLAGLMFPALGRAREKGRQVQCKANLKNLQIAVVNHANDSDGAIPFAGSFELKDHDGHWHKFIGWVSWTNYPPYPAGRDYHDRSMWQWYMVERWWGRGCIDSITNGTLWPYTGRNLKIYLCPTFAREEVSGRTFPDGSALDKNRGNVPMRSYVMSCYFHDRTNPSWYRRTMIGRTDSSKRLLFTEIHTSRNDPIGGVRPVCDRGFKDGPPATYYYAHDGSFAGTNRPGASYPVEAIGGYHDGYGYAVFLDGHIETLTWSNSADAVAGTL
ncbi:MAG: type II secretion system GspH family protein [Kiritimatiellae bacterium]|nr:type II secretion system GspH family protein [Kiritimatiellia bacterium]